VIKKRIGLIFGLLLFILNLNAQYSRKIEGDSFKIKIKHNFETFGDLIFELIPKLIKEIDPKIAAKNYLEYIKSTLNILGEDMNDMLDNAEEVKNAEAIDEAVTLIMQKFMNDLTKKENALKLSIYYLCFSEEVVFKINKNITICMQFFVNDMENIGRSGKDLSFIISAARGRLNKYLNDVINIFEEIFREHSLI